MKSMYKYELAARAGVSRTTFSRWLSRRSDELLKLGLQPSDKMLPPSVVAWICHEYGIDL